MKVQVNKKPERLEHKVNTAQKISGNFHRGKNGSLTKTKYCIKCKIGALCMCLK